MRLSFLGGADEIGASSTLIEIGGRNILCDCGIRMSGGQEAQPHLAAITQLDAILVTHAHMDHIGALPIIHSAFPRVPVHATAPTAALMRVMFGDALRLMEAKAEREGEIPLYGSDAVNSLLAKIRKAPMLDPVLLDENGLTAQFFPAGHILGAASIGLTGRDGSVLITGDISVDNQLTVPGMMAPRFQPDVMVVESTYGDRLHSSREAEERRLVRLIAETIGSGGKALVPAFALGRAQEVILILKRAMSRKEIPAFPVYVDGMVRSICEVYRDFPEDLAVPLRRQMAKSHPFFPDKGTIARVGSPNERQAILDGPPCAIIASSGMLTGGASVIYAKALAEDKKNLIALTGYQDEESPGRALLDLAEGVSKEMRFGSQSVRVAARVEKVGLSAHADRAQIAGLVSKMRPGHVVLVHGEGESRISLAQAFGQFDGDQIWLPGLGEELDLLPRKARKRPPTPGISGGLRLDEAAIEKLFDHLRKVPRLVTIRDLVLLWHGGDEALEEVIEAMKQLLDRTHYFVKDQKRPFLYRLADPETARSIVPRGPLDQQRAFDIVDRHLPKESGLYRRGLNPEAGILSLSFHFPDVAGTVQAETIAKIAAETGYEVIVKPEPHQGELAEMAYSLLPARELSPKPPVIRLETREVLLKVLHRTVLPQEALEAFTNQTGFRLVIETLATPVQAPKKFDAEGRLEINATHAWIDRAFVDQPHSPRRKSKKADAEGPYLELAFISSKVGERYRPLFEQLEYETGWKLRLAPSADQIAILSVLREVMPGDWEMTKSPGIHLSSGAVLVRLANNPGSEAIAEASSRLEERTGFRLEVEQKKT